MPSVTASFGSGSVKGLILDTVLNVEMSNYRLTSLTAFYVQGSRDISVDYSDDVVEMEGSGFCSRH